MKNRFVRRSLGIIVTLMLVIGVFSSAAVTANAVLGGIYANKKYTIIIKDVTRKYPDAKVILDAVNAKRSQLGLPALKMDKNLLEASMVRSAELPIWMACSSLSDEVYMATAEEQNNSYYYNEVILASDKTAAAAAEEILSGDDASAITSNYASEIGIGVATVGNNGKSFICIRVTNEKTGRGDFAEADSSVYLQETPVYQTTTAYGHNLELETPYPDGITIGVGESCSVEFTAKEKTGEGYTALLAPGLLSSDSTVCSVEDCNDALMSDSVIRGVSAGSTEITMILKGAFPKYTSSFTVNVVDSAPQPLSNNSTINSDLVTVGTKVLLTGAAEGGKKNYTYTYKYKRTTSRVWTTLGTENTSDTIACFTPSRTGVFDILVTVRDQAGETAEKSFVLTVADGKSTAFCNNSTISTTGAAPETRIKLTAAASGSSGYTYAFYYKRTNARKWTILGSEFGTGDVYSFTPRSEGEFNIKIDIIDKNREIVSRVFALSIISSYNDTGIVNKSSVNASSIKAGSRLTVTGAADGGTAPYQYAYYYKRAGASNWTTLGDFSDAASKSVTLRTAGDYIVKVAVKDSAGGMVSNNFDVTVEA